MSGFKIIFRYSFRIAKREWRRFFLPLTSLIVTSVVLLLILLLTSSSTMLLADQARELQGGDVVLESNTPIDGKAILDDAGIEPESVSEKLTFSGTLQSESATAPFSVNVIDNGYPLYGKIVLKDSLYGGLNKGELLIDTTGLERLGVSVGDRVSFGDLDLTVAEVVVVEPTSLFGGFSFLPKAFITQESFAEANVNPQFLRAEYSYSAKIATLTANEMDLLRAFEDTSSGIDVDIAGQDQMGLQFGLKTVSDFLIIAVLITAVLAAVNVYASVLYLVTVERKSLAVLLSLGITKNKLVYILGAALGYVVLLANIIGLTVGTAVFKILQSFIATKYFVSLPTPSIFIYCLVSGTLVFLIALMSFVPAVRKSLELNPKQILLGGVAVTETSRSYRSLLVITVSTLIPLVALASFLLQSFYQGLLVIGAIALVYIIVATVYSFIIIRLYKARSRMSFFVRSLVSQKYADGLFGVISFTSLFVALTALSILMLIQVSLERFLVNDLGDTVPSTYVLDVQPSQKDDLLSSFSELELFSNVRARIIAIDEVRIQDELEAGNPEVSREFGREFSLTARTTLLSSEAITNGVDLVGMPGEISVDEDFAKQANITLGSTIIFSIQGFEVSGTVTSLRSTDSRSGIPFFYFVMSPEDIGMFPSVYFGYAYYQPETQVQLGRFLAETMPNVSLIETQSFGTLLLQLLSTLLVLVLIVTVPPLLIATLLIAMLVVSSYSTRRREGARFRALGLSRKQSFWQYLIETISLTIIASFFAYGLGVLGALLLSINFLRLDSVVLFDAGLVSGLGLIIVFILSITLYLYKTDKMPLRELLTYE